MAQGPQKPGDQRCCPLFVPHIPLAQEEGTFLDRESEFMQKLRDFVVPALALGIELTPEQVAILYRIKERHTGSILGSQLSSEEDQALREVIQENPGLFQNPNDCQLFFQNWLGIPYCPVDSFSQQQPLAPLPFIPQAQLPIIARSSKTTQASAAPDLFVGNETLIPIIRNVRAVPSPEPPPVGDIGGLISLAAFVVINVSIKTYQHASLKRNEEEWMKAMLSEEGRAALKDLRDRTSNSCNPQAQIRLMALALYEAAQQQGDHPLHNLPYSFYEKLVGRYMKEETPPLPAIHDVPAKSDGLPEDEARRKVISELLRKREQLLQQMAQIEEHLGYTPQDPILQNILKDVTTQLATLRSGPLDIQASQGSEKRHELQGAINEDLDRLAGRMAQAKMRAERFENLHELHSIIERLLSTIYTARKDLSEMEKERLNHAAEHLQAVLEVSSQPEVPYRALREILVDIEKSLTGEIGSILIAHAVRDFRQQFPLSTPGGAKKPKARNDILSLPSSAALGHEIKPYSLRDYQEQMVKSLYNDAAAGTSPWLGLASPMQTGKSFLAGPLIQKLREGYGPQARFIILSSSRVITGQVVGDLIEGFPVSELGIFDGAQKVIRPVTVASVYSMARHLEEFNHDGPTILINDEAYFTQANIYRKIYTHFGLAEVVEEDGRSVMKPKAGNGLIIGLSGTGMGLEGYHLSGQYNILDAIQQGWIRNVRGERVMVTIPSEEKQSVADKGMIWWEATPENAAALADIYDEKIHGKYRRNFIFVPTTYHAELLKLALQARYGNDYAHTVHSKMEAYNDPDSMDRDADAVIAHWQHNGGALISVLQLARGFRGEGADAVFHTYQTRSIELFGQRTGRAWAGEPGKELPDLYVLEVTWNPHVEYASLPRLLGLVDYPHHEFSSRNIQERVTIAKQRREEREDIDSRIREAKVIPLFAQIPLVESWRNAFKDIVTQAGDINSLAQQTGLSVETLAGYALGGLPIRRNDVLRLAAFLGGQEQALALWVRSWQEAAQEIEEGIQTVEDQFSQELVNWSTWSEKDKEKNPRLAVLTLTLVLDKYFPVSARAKSLEGVPRLLEDIRLHYSQNARVRDFTDDELTALLHEARAEVEQEYKSDPLALAIIARRIFQSSPDSRSAILRDIDEQDQKKNLQLPEDKLRKRITLRTREKIARRLINELSSLEEKLKVGIGELDFDDKTFRIIDKVLWRGDPRSGLRVLDLVQLTEESLLKRMNRFTDPASAEAIVIKVKVRLAEMGLSLGMKFASAQRSDGTQGDVERVASRWDMEVAELELSVQTASALANGNIVYMGQLVQRTEGELLKRYMGRKSLREIKEVLAEQGLFLGMKLDGWQPPVVTILDPTPSIEPRLKEKLDWKIDKLELSHRTFTSLTNANIEYIGQLVQYTGSELLKTKNIGPRPLNEIKQWLARRGLSLGMKLDGWQPPK